jgi:hypothetical protein
MVGVYACDTYGCMSLRTARYQSVVLTSWNSLSEGRASISRPSGAATITPLIPGRIRASSASASVRPDAAARWSPEATRERIRGRWA